MNIVNITLFPSTLTNWIKYQYIKTQKLIKLSDVRLVTFEIYIYKKKNTI